MNRVARRRIMLAWATAPALVLALAAAGAAQTREIQEEIFKSQLARQIALQEAAITPTRFNFKIAANTPVRDLLPTAPTPTAQEPWLGDDLRQVPEVRFMQPLVSKGRTPQARAAERTSLLKQTAHIIARINHLNKQRTDYFLDQLLARRADLAGLPFVKGEACRQTDERRPAFTRAVNNVRSALQQSQFAHMNRHMNQGQSPNDVFWQNYRAEVAEQAHLKGEEPAKSAQASVTAPASLAALMQMLAAETDLHPGLVQRLKDAKEPETITALTRLALFSLEEDIRKSALAALQNRTTKEVDEALLDGFRYPWPQVAQRASQAVVSLKRTNLVPRLVDLLDQPDPREPVMQDNDGQQVQVVREMVRLNHHQNCLMCHAPADAQGRAPDAATGAVPLPGQPLPSLSEGYDLSSPDILVRADVTYLRPDFSVMQPVPGSEPWPRMQRFDFLVRTREVNEREREQWRQILAKRPADYVSPYQTAIASALRELTGHNAPPNAAAWRRILATTRN